MFSFRFLLLFYYRPHTSHDTTFVITTGCNGNLQIPSLISQSLDRPSADIDVAASAADAAASLRVEADAVATLLKDVCTERRKSGLKGMLQGLARLTVADVIV